MKNISIDSIGRLFLASILVILPLGCAGEPETEEQQPIINRTDTSTRNRRNIPENRETNTTLEEINTEDTTSPTEEVAIEPPVEEVAIERSAEIIELEELIYFNFDSAVLTEQAKLKLRQISPQLARSDRPITIAGHADERGSHDYNINLGHRRAKAVKDFLATQGVDRAKLSTVSHGETQPLVDASHPEAWSQNRRVDFTVD